MPEPYILEPQSANQKPPKRSTWEKLEDEERWAPLLRQFPDGENVKMALTTNYLRQFGVTLGPAARRRLRRRWQDKAQMVEPLDRLCWMAMEGAAGLDGEQERKEACVKLVDTLVKEAKADKKDASVPA